MLSSVLKELQTFKGINRNKHIKRAYWFTVFIEAESCHRCFWRNYNCSVLWQWRCSLLALLLLRLFPYAPINNIPNMSCLVTLVARLVALPNWFSNLQTKYDLKVLWRWCINTIIVFLDISIILFLFKTHNVLETLFSLSLWVEPPQLDPIDRASPETGNLFPWGFV
jgi:hypothetical protein